MSLAAPHLSSAVPFPASPSVAPNAQAPARGFVELDERLLAAGLGGAGGGAVVVRASAAATDALASHAARRLRGGGAYAIVARARAPHGEPMWREIASRLGLDAISSEPTRCAEQLLEASAARRAALVAPIAASGTWDRAVTAELARLAHGARDAIVLIGEDAAPDVRGDRFDVTAQGGALDDEARRRWWAAVAEEGNASAPEADVASLEEQWAARTRVSALAARAAEIPERGRAAFTALALVARAWPEAELDRLGSGLASGARELVQAGVATLDRGWLALDPAWYAAALDAARGATREENARAARALLARGGDEPWALGRAAILLLRAGDTDAADDAFARATARLEDTLARREIVSRWMDAIDEQPPAAQLTLRRRAAERALAVGEADEAHRWALAASSLAPDGTADAADIALLLGRAAVALGDLVTARVALERGLARANAAGDRAGAATFAVELAEVSYLTGDLAAAAKDARAAEDAAPSAAIRLHARNTTGKLLLAAAKWDDADRHFAEDAHAAAAAGERTAELRARLNRGIALLSKGLTEEARVVFEAVLADGERAGDARACAFALDNLTVLHSWRRDYGKALECSERTVKIRRRLGDRLSMARVLTNLAELRCMLGLFDAAEHAVAFGRRTIGPGMRIKGLSLSVIAARVALERGNTVLARREIGKAIVDCEAAGDSASLAEAYGVATRIALEDGDVARAAELLGKARELAVTDEVRAEVAVLAAAHARAAGRPAEETRRLAAEALAVARTHAREDYEREAHVLLCELHRANGELEAARAHLEHAVALRDRIAETLTCVTPHAGPEDARAAFLAQPSVANLARLQAALAETASGPLAGDEDDSPRTQRSSSAPAALGGAARELVGDDPAIRGLLSAVKKVARSSATVLIRGESGTGKELVAEALHRASDRASGPLVTVNCAALVETLLLSELFGHEKGAFTGAFARRRGRFELAEGGTLFLDEIGDISPRTQVALLRVLQERTFERVGGTTAIRANVRIVCATHRDLRAMVERGEFREDLYYRLRGITLEVPALRSRMGDLPRISETLLKRIAVERSEPAKALGADALDLLARHRWPGNVRELENALRAASLFAEGAHITASDIADNVDDLRALAATVSTERVGAAPSLRSVPRVLDAEPSRATLLPPPSGAGEDALERSSDDEGDAGAPLPTGEANATAVAYAQVRQGAVSLGDMKRQIERDCIARALAETKGNITRAAALLGMKRPRLSQLVKQYGLAAISSEDR